MSVVRQAVKRQMPLVLLCAVIVAGLMRMALVGQDPGSIKDDDIARRWAECLGARHTVATGVTVAVLPMQQKDAASLAFRAIGSVSGKVLNVSGAPKTLSAGTQVEIVKGASQDFQFRFVGGSAAAVVVAEGDARSLLEAGPVKFAPVASIPYTISLTNEVSAQPAADRSVVLPPGTEGRLTVDTGQSLETLQPLALEPWLVGQDSRTQPISAVARIGIADLEVDTVKAAASGRGAPPMLLAACAEEGQADLVPIGVTDPGVAGVGSGSIKLTIPASLQQTSWRPTETLKLAIVDVNGDYRAYGAFSIISRLYSGIGALALTAFFLWWLLRLRHRQLAAEHRGRKTSAGALNPDATRWMSSLFIGPDHDPSLSLFQVFFWTVITAWGWLYVFIATGSLLSLTPDMMVLLGIAGTGSVLARWITNQKQASTSQDATNGGNLDDFSFWQILSSEGNFDLLKLQVFVFTLLVGIYVVWRIAVAGAFPTLDTNTLLLLGVSQGVYIGGKLTGASTLADVQAVKIELDTEKSALADMSARVDVLSKKGREALSPGEQKELDDLSAKIVASNTKITALETAYAEGLKMLKLQT